MGRGQLIQVRRDTAANWASVNPILASGEAGYETDTGYLKYGDGSTAWSDLDYFAPGSADPDTTLLGNPITAQELDYLSGVSSNVQTQLNAKASSASVSSVASDLATVESAVESIQSDLADAVGEGELVRESAVASDLDTAIIVTAAPYNATGDAIMLQDGNITASSTTLTSATAEFTAEDVGKKVIIYAAGASGGIGATDSGIICKPLVTTISARTNSTTVTLALAATTTVTNGRFIYGTDDTAAIQSALDALSTPNGGRVVFPAGMRFIVSSTLTIPRYGLPNDPRFQFSSVVVSGYGAHLHLCGTTMIGLQVVPPVSYDDEMLKRFATSVMIEGLTIEGTGVTTQTGIDISHTFGSTIQDCIVAKTGYGFRVRFGICVRVLRCTAESSTVYPFALETANGQVTGATVYTPTNATVLDGCIALANGIASAHFYLYNCDQVELRNCIAETGPDDTNEVPYTVVIDNLADAALHGVSISNFYTETTAPSVAVFGIINNGYVTLEKIRRYGTVGCLVDATGSSASSIVCRDWTLLTTSSGGTANSWIKFKQNAGDTVGWTFENMGEIARGETTNLVTNDALWVGGVIPTRITQIEPGRIASAP